MDRKCWPSDDRTRVPCLKRWRAIYAQPSRESSRRRQPRGRARWCFGSAWLAAGLAATIIASVALTAGLAGAATLLTPSRSTTITITPDNNWLLVVNRETNSVSIIGVRGAQGQDIAFKLAEIPVGIEPRCVALHPNAHEAYVTNGVSGTVSVIDLASLRVAAEIPVGLEPRGCALTPNGTWLLVANHTGGSLGVIDTASRAYLRGIPLPGNPMAIAVTNNGDTNEADETVFVTQFFAELIPNGLGEGRDTGKRGVVHAIPLATLTPAPITLSPFSNVGFTSNRSQFCPQTFVPPAPGAVLHNPIFCPDVNAPAGSPVITQAPQGAFPNQLASALIRGNRLFLPNIGAGPEPVERFDANVQAFVHVVDTSALAEVAAEHVNLNVEIATEPAPVNPTASLARLFGNDLIAIDANLDGSVFLIVSRGGNYVLRAIRSGNSQLSLGAPNVIRWQTGNLPDGVVISYDGLRAYVNNQANVSVTVIDLETNSVVERDVPSGEPPAPGTVEHAVLVGKLAFFTALGIPDNGFFDTPIRDFDPLLHRGKMSNNAWSSCGSCHPDGLADGVTWFFGTGPRQTIPLDGTFAKDSNMHDQRLLNWSAVRGSNTDFNANSRVTQGGCGFASDEFDPGQCLIKGSATIANPAIYDHGITQGGSDALDVQTLWIFAAVRPLNQPQPSDTAALEAGRAVFEANCASCHGGPKWSKSQIFHRDNPAAVSQGGAPLDPGVLNRANEFRSFTCNTATFNYLDDVGTFDGTNPLEIRDITAITALGADGFNAPSLLSVRYHAPYLHRGQAQTLADVFPLHALGGGTIASLPAQDQQDLLVFLNAIDGTTDHLRSAGDDFRDALRLQVPPCPQP